MSDSLSPEQEQYWRYNPTRPPGEFADRWNRGPNLPYENRERPALVQLVDPVVGSCPQPVQDQWAELRPFILDPGEPAQLRAAADAWKPEGESGGSESLFSHIDSWRNNVHDTTFELRRKWQDEASEALDSFVNNKVDDCFDALESRCEAVATAIRAMADAQDALNESIEDAMMNSGVGAAAGVVVAVGGVVLTGLGICGRCRRHLASRCWIRQWAYQAFCIYKDFVDECRKSLDKLGVSLKELGEADGTWPRPWAQAKTSSRS